jgi:hypothetical protein
MRVNSTIQKQFRDRLTLIMNNGKNNNLSRLLFFLQDDIEIKMKNNWYSCIIEERIVIMGVHIYVIWEKDFTLRNGRDCRL